MAYTDAEVQTILQDFPHGGGEYYSESEGKLDPATADVTVSTASELESAAGPNHVIEIAADIDLTGYEIDLGNSTLVGDRGWPDGSGGVSDGPIISSNTHGTTSTGVSGRPYAMLYARGTDTPRVTGLRLEGYYTSTSTNPYTDDEDLQRGVWFNGNGGEVDNCEIYGFTWAAVMVGGLYTSYGETHGVSVHHCHIHRTLQDGYGYGINFARGSGTVDHCYFNYNRHSLNGQGRYFCEYTAEECVFGPDMIGHMVDMHCLTESGHSDITDPDDPDFGLRAGGGTEARKCTFLESGSAVGTARGEPWEYFRLTDNWISHSSIPTSNSGNDRTGAWYQQNVHGVTSGGTTYDALVPEGEYTAAWGTSGNALGADDETVAWSEGTGALVDFETPSNSPAYQGYDTTTDPGSGDYLDLTDRIPQEAIDIRDAKPDIRAEYDTISAADEGYGNRSGDLANLIESAAANNQIVDLGSGTYEMESTVNVSSGTVGVIGDGSDVCTVYYSGTDIGYLFNVQGPNTYVNEGVTYDITEPAPNGLDTDVGLTTAEVSNEVWCEDIELRGQRHYIQDYDGDGDVEPPSTSRRFTFLIEMTSYSGTAYLHNCRFPDGGTDEAWRDYIGTVGHAIGPNADPSHIGTNVWHECYAEGFMDNGFYVNNSPGPNILWNCTARNNAAGNIRLGDGDFVIGGYSEVTDLPNERLGQCLALTGGDNITVIGLELYAEHPQVSDSMLQIRSSSGVDTTNAYLEKVVGHSVDANAAVRATGFDTEFSDCYFLDETPNGSSTIRGVTSSSSSSRGEDLKVLNLNGSELHMSSSSHTFEYGGTTYSNGTWTASEVGFGDPRPLPNFYVGEPTTEEFDIVFEVVDGSGRSLSGATVTLDGDETVVTGSDGIADFGLRPSGDYSYTVSLDGYIGASGTYSNTRNRAHRVELTEITADTGSVNLTVTNKDNVPIGGVDVTLYGGEGLIDVPGGEEDVVAEGESVVVSSPYDVQGRADVTGSLEVEDDE